MDDDDILDAARRRVERELMDTGGQTVDGYRVRHNGSSVEITFIVGAEEYAISLPREHARRLGIRVCVAARRSKAACQN